MLKKCKRCGFRDCLNERHHITYEPEKTAYLCRKCHALITSLNTIYTGVSKKKLISEERLLIWKIFMTPHGWSKNLKIMVRRLARLKRREPKGIYGFFDVEEDRKSGPVKMLKTQS